MYKLISNLLSGGDEMGEGRGVGVGGGCGGGVGGCCMYHCHTCVPHIPTLPTADLCKPILRL